MTDVSIYHNPRCSKSRQTLEILHQHGINPEIILYLEMPPTEVQLKEILALLNISARGLLRTSEAAYKENGLSDKTLPDSVLIKAMLSHPKLIERPIVLANGKAALGRPPENVLDII